MVPIKYISAPGQASRFECTISETTTDINVQPRLCALLLRPTLRTHLFEMAFEMSAMIGNELQTSLRSKSLYISVFHATNLPAESRFIRTLLHLKHPL